MTRYQLRYTYSNGDAATVAAPSRDRRKLRRICRLTARTVARLQRANPAMPRFVVVSFQVAAR